MEIKVKVTAGAKKEKLEKLAGIFYISVKEKPQNNKANERVLELIANHFEVLRRDVKITRGYHSPNKTLEIPD